MLRPVLRLGVGPACSARRGVVDAVELFLQIVPPLPDLLDVNLVVVDISY